MSLAYGAEWQREEGTSDGSLDFGGGFVLPTSFELTRTSWAPFAEVRLRSSFGLSTQAGVRVDNPDDMSSVTSPRVRVAYELPDTGFTRGRTPGARRSNYPACMRWGIRWSAIRISCPSAANPMSSSCRRSLLDGTARWSATWFDGEFRNAIDFDSGPPPMLVNRNRVDTSRVSSSPGGWVSVKQWMLDASVTNAKSRIASTGGELRNRPEWRAGSARTGRRLPRSSSRRRLPTWATSFDSSIATGDVDLPAYTTRGCQRRVASCRRSSRRISPSTTSPIEQYEQFVGFEVRGIAPRLGVKFSF